MGISNHASHEKESALTDGVVAAGEVVRGILLTGDQLLRVEELAVGTLQKKSVRKFVKLGGRGVKIR